MAAAAKATYELEVFLEASMLRAAREDPNLHGLGFNLRPSDLMVSHAEAQMAGRHARQFAGLRNLGSTCFVNVTLQVFLHVAALRSRIANPLPPLVISAGDIVVATARLTRVKQAL